jgi:hypothetical protein
MTTITNILFIRDHALAFLLPLFLAVLHSSPFVFNLYHKREHSPTLQALGDDRHANHVL